MERSRLFAQLWVTTKNFDSLVLVPPPENDELLDSVADYVWNQYSNKPSLELSDLTHQIDGAWNKARQEAHGIRGKDVPNNYIFEDFKGLVEKDA